jgi:hypothetical protein
LFQYALFCAVHRSYIDTQYTPTHALEPRKLTWEIPPVLICATCTPSLTQVLYKGRSLQKADRARVESGEKDAESSKRDAKRSNIEVKEPNVRSSSCCLLGNFRSEVWRSLHVGGSGLKENLSCDLILLAYARKLGVDSDSQPMFLLLLRRYQR